MSNAKNDTPDGRFAAAEDRAAGGSLDRRSLLLAAAGGLAAAGLSNPARAASEVASLAARSGAGIDPALARRLRRVLHDALRDPSTKARGAILGVKSPKLGGGTGAAGLGRIAPAVAMRPADRFRAG